MATASSVSSSSSMERIMSLPHSSMTMRLRHSNVPSLLRLSPQAARSSFSSSFRSPTGFRRCIGSKRSPIFKIRASFSDEETSESDTRIRKVFSNVKDTVRLSTFDSSFAMPQNWLIYSFAEIQLCENFVIVGQTRKETHSLYLWRFCNPWSLVVFNHC
uniref:ST6-40 n=1 Tax=Solanum tuberosum TaxID=4113 RepID=M1A885_SOLTU